MYGRVVADGTKLVAFGAGGAMAHVGLDDGRSSARRRSADGERTRAIGQLGVGEEVKGERDGEVGRLLESEEGLRGGEGHDVTLLSDGGLISTFVME